MQSKENEHYPAHRLWNRLSDNHIVRCKEKKSGTQSGAVAKYSGTRKNDLGELYEVLLLGVWGRGVLRKKRGSTVVEGPWEQRRYTGAATE